MGDDAFHDFRSAVDAEPAGEPFDEDTSDVRHPKLAAWWSEMGGGSPSWTI